MRTPTLHRGSRRAGGTLSVLIGMLILSVLFRVVGGTGLAVAQQIGKLGDRKAEVPTAQSCEPAPDVARVLATLDDRAAALDDRARKLDEHEQTLSLTAEVVDENLASLEAAEADLSRKLDIAREAAETDLSRLTAVYENMKSAKAAALFERMAPGFAAGFLARMNPVAAAEIMAGLNPDTAYTISAMLAGRNADVPTE